MDKQWHEEYVEELHEKQDGKTRQEIADELGTAHEHVFDSETAPKQSHRWVDRGLKLSCEFAGHPWHEAWKIGGKPM
jgi:hypothetical protein